MLGEDERCAGLRQAGPGQEDGEGRLQEKDRVAAEGPQGVAFLHKADVV